MQRITILVMSVVLCAAFGCEQMNLKMNKRSSETMSMHDMKRPSPPVQLRQLDPFIGNWEGTAEMVPHAGSPAATQPVETYKGGGSHEWTLDGMAMKSTGWHEMPNGQKMSMVEYVTWDPRAKKFRSYWVSDWGEHGTGWMWAEPNGQQFHWTGKSTDALGNVSSMNGTMSIMDKDRMDFDFTGDTPHGPMHMKGSSRRTATSSGNK